MLYLFDIDGTLISGDGAGRRSFDRACLDVMGIAGALDGLKLDGMTDPLILRHVFDKHLHRAPTDAESREILSTYVKHLGPEVARSKYVVHDAVADVLDLLEKKGAILGLATGNVREGARIKLERGNLWHRFVLGGFGDDAPDRAELVRMAVGRGLSKLARRLEREEMLVIGDTPKDIAAAHAAGAWAVGVATGSYTVDELRAAGADVAVPTLREWMATL